jgi:hypothetical protein
MRLPKFHFLTAKEALGTLQILENPRKAATKRLTPLKKKKHPFGCPQDLDPSPLLA